FFFFFQAEDGIRDRNVTGVQTCALPIFLAGSFARLLGLWRASESSALVRAWEHRGHLLGTKLTVHVSKEDTASGRFGGLDPDGEIGRASCRESVWMWGGGGVGRDDRIEE